MAVAAGTRIGPYEILSPLGAGGMGEVWRAKDSRLNRDVAIKVLPASFANNADRLRRFEQEAKAASALNHPNIITIHEIGEAEACRFIVMELVQGQTLRALKKPCSLDLLLNVGRQIARALSAAHTAGITHRDLKPDNLMLRDDGYVKVLDFGLARLSPGTTTDSGAVTLAQQTMPGTLLGTVAYMSPEQARGEKATPACDLFALGLVLYELATGQHPFQSGTLIGMLQAITTQAPVPSSRLNADIPADLDALILRMLEKDGRLRPTAAEVSRELNELNDHGRIGSAQGESKPTPSIAVLPFVNISNDPENEYFCDGLAEELLNALSKIEALRVAARTSAFSFKGKGADIRDISQKLNVGAVLEGSVRKSGNRLRITAQLINVADGYHLWSERYDREMQDIFDIQDEISLSIVDALKVKLLTPEKASVLKRHTANPEAYQLYLRGRLFWNKRTPLDLQKAIEYFQQAIQADPSYALAYTGLADTYSFLPVYNLQLLAREVMPKAKEAALKALSLDDNLAEAHAALGLILFYYDYDFLGAEREYKRALELNPNYATTHLWYGNWLLIQGRFDESFAECRRALEIDPLSVPINYNYSVFLYIGRRYDEAITQAKKAQELDANSPLPHIALSLAYYEKGMYPEAVEEFAQYFELFSNRQAAALIRERFAKGGLQAYWMALLGEPQSPFYSYNQYNMAVGLAALGEKDQAFAELNKAYDNRNFQMLTLKVAPLLDPLRDDPRFQELLARIGFPQ